MKTLMALFEGMDPMNKDILMLVAIVVAGAALAVWIFCRKPSSTDY